jgi:hypothetical protein
MSLSSRSITRNHEPIATYPTYEEAQKTVDYLSDQGFPVAGTLIVGAGLRLVERVVGRMTYLRAAGAGAAAGAWFGLLIGLFLGIFSVNPMSLAALVLWGLVWGLIAGAVFGLISHALTGGRRDFVSTTDLVADEYEVFVESEHVMSARQLLGRMSG